MVLFRVYGWPLLLPCSCGVRVSVTDAAHVQSHIWIALGARRASFSLVARGSGPRTTIPQVVSADEVLLACARD
jgi:hypothetical protein